MTRPKPGRPGKAWRSSLQHCLRGHPAEQCMVPYPGGGRGGGPARRCRCCALETGASTYMIVRFAASLLGLPVSHYLAAYGGGRAAATAVISAVESGSALPPRRSAAG